MRRRLSLRARVALACGLIGLCLSLVFAAATTWVAEDYEYILIEAILAGQAETWQTALARDPTTILPVSDGFAIYREADAPEEFRALAAGVHEIESQGEEGVHAAAFGDAGHRLVLVIEVGQIEVLELYLARVMIAIVLVGTVLASWLGWILAKRATWPVTRLAKSVATLPPRPVATSFASQHGRDEIGKLADAIDEYQRRLVDVDAAERRFFADASHELRTPIAVIQGATEVMKDDQDVNADQAPRLARIDRALLELSSLLEALLLSARSLPAENDQFDLSDVIDAAVARLSSTDPDWGRRLRRVESGIEVPVRAPRRWVDGIVTVLLQRLLGKAPGTTWEIRVAPGTLIVTQPGAPAEGFEQPIERSDLGMNLIFVERLCRNLGWQLEQTMHGDGQMAVRVLIANDDIH